MPSSLRIFGWSIGVTLAAVIFSVFAFHPAGTLLVIILIVLEVSLSFDNAVVNAKILTRMNEFWQKIFLTIGVLIAVFGMRLVFPLLLVGITAQMGPLETIQLALDGGTGAGSYADRVHDAHPAIAGFGGMFLMMLFLDWLFEDRDIKWLNWLEEPLARIGKLNQVSVVIALTALTLAAELLADGAVTTEVLVSGVLGVITYLAVNGLGMLFEGQGDDDDEEPEPVQAAGGNGKRVSTVGKASGKAGFFLFLYLEVLDASFSFDGVVGAFAITQDIFIIAIGLGVGAFWIRSLTVFLVRKGTLNDYVYLEHGAHWAIGALAVILLVTIKYEVNEIITGLVGVGFIGLAFLNSIMRNRRHPELMGEGMHA